MTFKDYRPAVFDWLRSDTPPPMPSTVDIVEMAGSGWFRAAVHSCMTALWAVEYAKRRSQQARSNGRGEEIR